MSGEQQQAQAPQANDPVVNIQFRVSGLNQVLGLIATADYQLRNAIITDLQAQAKAQLEGQAAADSAATEAQA
jgi:hypothetical protein